MSPWGAAESSRTAQAWPFSPVRTLTPGERRSTRVPLRATGGNAIGNSSTVTLANVAGATLDLAGSSETIGSLAGGGATGGNVTLGAGTLTTGTATSTTYAGVISGTGGLTKVGTGVFTLTGNNTYTGATTINTGSTLQIGGGSTTGSIAGDVVDNGTLIFNRSNDLTFGGSISGSGAVTKIAAGTLTLSGANWYTSATTISAGTLVATSNNALGSPAGGTTVASGATLGLQGGITVTGEAITITGSGLGGNGAIRNLSGANMLTGPVTLGANPEIQSDAGSLTLSGPVGGTNRTLTLDGAGNTSLTGNVSLGSGAIIKNGYGLGRSLRHKLLHRGHEDQRGYIARNGRRRHR